MKSILVWILAALSGFVFALPLPQSSSPSDVASTGGVSDSLSSHNQQYPDPADCVSYGSDGLAADGRDRAGYDADGYDSDGFGHDGLDKAGNMNGTYALDSNGFDKDGYNLQGRDREGYNALGYNADGFNRNGYDRNGYDRNDKDPRGIARSRFSVRGLGSRSPIVPPEGNSCSSTSSTSSSSDPETLKQLGLNLPDLQDQLGPVPINTNALLDDVYAAQTGDSTGAAGAAPPAATANAVPAGGGGMGAVSGASPVA
ncbi:hypothetical protein Rhopal_001070-T1 [Rhodotorula paludigena]|uniref:Uncharacterized protein n=1 Tax=Rhodotorula paludigena TaxID=86838 RepID=A0AAV5GFI7_9BASI|nr:hypothetical protein Rhopal_001070-T1 [Rhodotorula paludigena]